jgi:hypothetical protein
LQFWRPDVVGCSAVLSCFPISTPHAEITAIHSHDVAHDIKVKTYATPRALEFFYSLVSLLLMMVVASDQPVL